MQEKAESDKAFREEELNIRKKEETKVAQFQAMLPQQQSFLQAMTQQQKQNQHLQMLTAQQSQALMSVLEKLFLKEWLKNVKDQFHSSLVLQQEVLD